MFKLGIIEESLIEKQVLEILKEDLVSQRVQNVPEAFMHLVKKCCMLYCTESGSNCLYIKIKHGKK